MKKISSMALFLVLSLVGFAQQEDSTLPFSNPVAPNAFEFIKYGEVPVSHYTGIPNVNIPIYTIEAKGLKLPINLSYHAGGFKVNEESGVTGLGWTLPVGGSITQVVNGFDDFGPQQTRDNEFQSMYTSLHNGPVLDIANCEPGLSWKIQKTHVENVQTGVGYYDYNDLKMSGIKDLEPDIFKFSFLGYSGEFVLNWATNEFVCLNDPKIKIEGLMNGSYPYFRIITPEGHTLMFDVVEETEITYTYNPYQSGLNLLGNVSSRHYKLGYIVTNLGETINFNYDVINIPVYNLPSVTQTIQEGRRDYVCQGGNGVPCNDGSSGTTISQRETRTKQAVSYYLKDILFTNGKVEFENSSSRLDINNTMKLDKINIKFGNQLINSFDFNYDYFIGDHVPSHTAPSGYVSYDEWSNLDGGSLTQTQTELSHRLKLTSIKENGKPAHLFSYYDEDKFLKKTVKANLWGFSNDITRLKAGVLHTITYPSGGITEFKYEPHEYNNYQEDVYNYDNQNISLYSESGAIAISSLYNNDGLEISYGGTMTAWEVGPCADYNDYDNVKVSIKKWKRDMSSNYPIPLELLSETSLIPGYTNQMLSQNFSGTLASDEMLTATVEMNLISGCQTSSGLPHCFVELDINSSVYDSTVTSSIRIPAGLRVTSIASSPDVNDAQSYMVKEYVYHEGKSMSPIIREIDELKNEYCVKPILDANGTVTGYNDIHCTYMQTTKYNTSYYPPSSNASGKYIGYDKVEEIVYNHDKTKQNGKIVKEFINTPDTGFTNFLDNPNNVYFSRFFPLQKSYPENGSLENEKIYSKTGDILKEYQYQYVSEDNFCMYGRRSFYHDSYTYGYAGITPIEVKTYAVGFYPIKSKNTLLSNKTSIAYFSGTPVTTTESYDYDSYQQLQKHTIVASDGETSETNYKYSYNFLGESPYALMSGDNFLSPVVEREMKRNNERTGLERSYHKQWNVNNFTSYPVTKQSSLKGSDTQLQEMLLLHKYDNDHNLVEFSKKDGTRTHIVWGYNGKHPIAVLENASYNNFTSTQNNIIASAVQASHSDIDQTTENALKQALKNLREAFPNAFVKTYTYDPLIGITSMTDQRGYTMYYEYDELNRLKYIKDAENNIISSNDYNYKNNN